jgi:hypothetical protein
MRSKVKVTINITLSRDEASTLGSVVADFLTSAGRSADDHRVSDAEAFLSELDKILDIPMPEQ